MSTNARSQDRRRADLRQEVLRLGRENSTASVFFHSAVGERLGINVTDEKVLDLLLRGRSLTAGQIAAHTGLTSGSVTSLIDRLERRGFVRRTRTEADRRKVFVELVPDAVAANFQLFASLSERLSALLESYTIDELETIEDFLAKSSAILHREARRLQERPEGPADQNVVT